MCDQDLAVAAQHFSDVAFGLTPHTCKKLFTDYHNVAKHRREPWLQTKSSHFQDALLD